MTILFITNRSFLNLDESFKWFDSYCDAPCDLIIRYNLLDAKFFLENTIIAEQKHLDFIITDWSFKDQNSKDLLNWIRNCPESYSSKNFQFRSLPILLIEDTKSQSSAINEGFDGLIKGFPDELWSLRWEVRSVIKNWRNSLAKDLDLIGLDPRTQKSYESHRKFFISYDRLEVLTKIFVDDKSKKLNYLWSNNNVENLDHSSELFHSMISKTYRNPRAYSEKDFHKLFKENLTLIKGEHFFSSKTREEMIYEPRLYKSKTQYDIPDFLNNPYTYSLRSPEIFEIKLQTQKLLRYESERFISKAKRSFTQAKRYLDYVNSSDPRHQSYIIKYFGKIHPNYQATLLMGSKEEKQANEDLIERLKNDFDFKDINLITYEELLDNHLRLCNRLSLFNIF